MIAKKNMITVIPSKILKHRGNSPAGEFLSFNVTPYFHWILYLTSDGFLNNAWKSSHHPRKDVLYNAISVKISFGQLTLTSPRVILSRERESKMNRNNFIKKLRQTSQRQISHEKFTPRDFSPRGKFYPWKISQQKIPPTSLP